MLSASSHVNALLFDHFHVRIHISHIQKKWKKWHEAGFVFFSWKYFWLKLCNFLVQLQHFSNRINYKYQKSEHFGCSLPTKRGLHPWLTSTSTYKTLTQNSFRKLKTSGFRIQDKLHFSFSPAWSSLSLGMGTMHGAADHTARGKLLDIDIRHPLLLSWSWSPARSPRQVPLLHGDILVVSLKPLQLVQRDFGECFMCV